MSEARERAKEIDRLMEAYWNAAYREGVEFRIHDDEAGTAQKASAELRGFITDLLAELERVEGSVGIPIDRIAELECQKNACQQVVAERDQRIAELEDSLKKVQNIAKSAMDNLPERWNMGFQAGLKQAIPHEKELTDALAAERQGRKDDNAALTEDILRLEAENNCLKAWKAGTEIAQDDDEQEIRVKAAKECVEIIQKYPAWLFGIAGEGVRLNLTQGIKSHFNLEATP